jgi:hypothetical protein
MMMHDGIDPVVMPRSKVGKGRNKILYRILYQHETLSDTFDHNHQHAVANETRIFLVFGCVKLC